MRKAKEMSESEKTLKALDERILYASLFNDKTVECSVELLNKVRDLVHTDTIPVYWDTKMSRWWECKSCGNQLHACDKFCSECGKRVDWDKEEHENDD